MNTNDNILSANALKPLKALPVLGTPLLYQVSQDTVGNPVPIQNQTPHTLAIQAADFGGGTVTIEWSLDAATWNPLLDSAGQPAAFTENTLKVGISFCGIYLRASLAGSTNPQNLTVTLG
ncbi:MAG: hypothetical protein K0R49_81 [Burkholderiales bacterium]|jgi:hypothetical protein|nr:hypothetical protein [Burkholderiales bacterium]